MRTQGKAEVTTPRSPRLLFLVRSLTYLALVLVSFQGCTTQQEHKWLFYDLRNENDVVYQGYKLTKSPENDLTPTGKIRNSITLRQTPTDIIALDKPTIDEDDQLHFVVFGSMLPEAACHFVEKPYAQPHDSKLVPQYKPTPPEDSTDIAAQLTGAKELVGELQQIADESNENAKRLEETSARAKKESARTPKNGTFIDAEAAAKKARRQAQTASQSLKSAKDLVERLQAQLQTLQVTPEKKSIVCDLDVREKGSTKIDFTLLKSQKLEPKDIINGEDIILKDSVLVHELYRYRILAGPVFSTLQKRNKTYELRPNNAGQSVITAIPAQDHPANFALLLKVYHTKRDTLDPPSLLSDPWTLSGRWKETFNPIIGINLLDKPLQNFYAGISFEPWGGFDIIGGVHWAKTQQLVDGFSQGQVTTQASGLTKERFNNGWFVGVAADIGIITTWLKSAGSGIATAIKATP